ncbi:MAG: tyrosine-protein phosphatase, partial [Rhodospirillaceae bacterium]
MQRLIPFGGIVNFRDLGGYESKSGQRTRWNALYRSGHLARSTDADLEALKRLRLSAICDFRTAEERDRAPSRVPETWNIARLSLDIWPTGARVPTDVARSMIFDGESLEDVHESQRVMYR